DRGADNPDDAEDDHEGEHEADEAEAERHDRETHAARDERPAPLAQRKQGGLRRGRGTLPVDGHHRSPSDMATPSRMSCSLVMTHCGEWPARAAIEATPCSTVDQITAPAAMTSTRPGCRYGRAARSARGMVASESHASSTRS